MNKTIRVANLARVEGEGALKLKIKDGRVTEAKFSIFEAPRFFEGFLRGRRGDEAPDLTARICGICPVAYQMSSTHALEGILGLSVDGQLRELRRLLYCGEWIESHALHVYFLHAPDFLGYSSAIALAQDYPEIVKEGLALKKAGNDLVALLGGREIHPVNVRVGGFYRTPRVQELRALADQLQAALKIALKTVRWVAGFDFPDAAADYEFVALRHPEEYPLCQGRLVSSRGLDISAFEYEDHFAEEHVRHSTALQSHRIGAGRYLVGPMARFNLNFDRLTPLAQAVAREVGLTPDCRNPFQSIIVRSVELVFACEEALRIIQSYERPDRPCLTAPWRAGRGCAISEAPRGSLYHRYTLDEHGVILNARLVPPTSQNQKSVEDDLSRVAEANLHLDDDRLTLILEQAIRNYDPCISCSTHCLHFQIER
ncbi:MAG TPA: Ni/Fe hydrogenase subunit alpha [Desulfobacterales bacterium]|nr:Ni/Fe hydrogenase subunit alpha [Desulfobacterales bacterium]